MCVVQTTSFVFERSYVLYQCSDGVKKNSIANPIISIFAKLVREMIRNSEVSMCRHKSNVVFLFCCSQISYDMSTALASLLQ